MIRLLIADDHPVVRQRLQQLLHEEFPSAFFGLASDTDSLVDEALSNEWDVIISDLVMPGGGGLHALKKIKEVKPSSLVIIISIYPEEQYSSRALSQGAAAFMNKNNADVELANTVKSLLEKAAKKTT